MFAKIKIILIILVIISCAILVILFLQDRTKKLEDRKYKDITTINIDSDIADINIYKSEDEMVKVVIYGTNKDFVELIEGTGYINVSKKTGNNRCFLNCRNEVNIYVPETMQLFDIKSEIGNITFEDVIVKDIKINTDKGNITIDKTNAVTLNTNIGNVTINELNSLKDSTIKTDIGNVTIKTIINTKLDTKSESGSVVIPVFKDEQDFTLKIETGVGNIDIDHHENKSE